MDKLNCRGGACQFQALCVDPKGRLQLLEQRGHVFGSKQIKVQQSFEYHLLPQARTRVNKHKDA
jgi:hypothetical protein